MLGGRLASSFLNLKSESEKNAELKMQLCNMVNHKMLQYFIHFRWDTDICYVDVAPTNKVWICQKHWVGPPSVPTHTLISADVSAPRCTALIILLLLLLSSFSLSWRCTTMQSATSTHQTVTWGSKESPALCALAMHQMREMLIDSQKSVQMWK